MVLEEKTFKSVIIDKQAVIILTKPYWLCNERVLLLSQIITVFKVKQIGMLGNCWYEGSLPCFSRFAYTDLGLMWDPAAESTWAKLIQKGMCYQTLNYYAV